jgi:homoserine acetyltransferase
MMASDDYSVYDLGDFELKSGGSIPKAQIAYKTFGDPSSPAVIYPSWYSGCKFPSFIAEIFIASEIFDFFLGLLIQAQ